MKFQLRQSISRRLTVLNVLVSGIAVLLACTALFAYDLSSFRRGMLSDLSIQAQIIGYNAVTPIVFNDVKSAEQTLAALQASTHVIYAGIYKTDGQFFAGYWRTGTAREPLPLINGTRSNLQWIKERQFAVARPIIFDKKPVGTVYIRSDINALIDRFDNYVVILAGIVLLSLLAALVIARISQRAISEPIMELAETARLVSREQNYGIRATPTKSQDEVALLINSFNRMLAEIQQRDTALQDSEQQFRTLADSVPQLAWMAEPDGTVFWFNQRWYEYTGTTPEKMEGSDFSAILDSQLYPEIMARWETSLRNGQPFEMAFPVRGEDGTFRDFLTLAVPVRDAEGKIARWFGTNTDITEQRRSEEALRKSEKLAATGRLAASIAHEINNPLEAVTNLIYLARKYPSRSEKYLEMADTELERMAEITRHTLGFFRDTSTPTSVDIGEVLKDVLRLYERKLLFKKIAVIARFGDRLAVNAFPGEIRQIFSNLVANAVDALGESGRLWIKAVRVHETADGHRPGVRVSVMDDGAGVSPDHLLKIFEPFYTTKKDVGTGLGLWLTRTLVNKHQGAIRVRSRTGDGRTGTIFSIFLPSETPQLRNSPADA